MKSKIYFIALCGFVFTCFRATIEDVTSGDVPALEDSTQTVRESMGVIVEQLMGGTIDPKATQEALEKIPPALQTASIIQNTFFKLAGLTNEDGITCPELRDTVEVPAEGSGPSSSSSSSGLPVRTNKSHKEKLAESMQKAGIHLLYLTGCKEIIKVIPGSENVLTSEATTNSTKTALQEAFTGMATHGAEAFKEYFESDEFKGVLAQICDLKNSTKRIVENAYIGKFDNQAHPLDWTEAEGPEGMLVIDSQPSPASTDHKPAQ